MKTYLAIIIIVLGFQFDMTSQKKNETFTIYLVRHCEKDLSTNNYTDPPLTACGVQRSEHLDTFFKDVHLDAVFSTDYTRTKNTALPTATSKGLEIKEYNAQDLVEFSKCLLNHKEDVLVVGHSNTTGVLAGLLSGQEIGSFDEDIYNRIYQVVVYKNTGRLHVFHTSFECVD